MSDSHVIMNRETYIGDGLFVSFDGYSVILRTDRLTTDTCTLKSDPDSPYDIARHVVMLEPVVFQAFIEYVNEHVFTTCPDGRRSHYVLQERAP